YQLSDGVLRDRAGNAVEFSLTTNAGNKIRERMCTILQEDWNKLGIKVNYRPVDFTTLVEKLDTTYDWDAILIGFTSSPDPHTGANLLRSNGNLHMWHPNQAQPATEWEAEIDRLVEAGSRELDRERRRGHYWRIQEILHQQLPMVQTVRSIDHVAYRRNLRNFERTVWGDHRPELLRFEP
ncbi:MAG TPA: ABC transporter substrate-binding protein, partial [Terriglobales bacterium]|nr:ABC transporter substrate-binding protein [Terriglobales bacterium]